MSKLYPSNSMILRFEVGEARGANGSYELFTLTNQEPLIRSTKTGRYFHLSWSDILQMAEAAGVDKEE